ncbi:hypothetical protein [Citricoccus sp. I39-566]|uniref:hypothetical protein n=1 Tax=Citricoccus sp. I39-566 TaxID=3073268 RepID=UPI00286C4028|nr:hypothetical protein [Citricoccus sp. I39-566]WMY76938.1 hypothetical protein RE421_08585 [Citricoccus sp. I39-566]
MTAEDTQHPDLQRLLRWEDAGGTWSVAARHTVGSGGAGEEVTLSLLTCDGGEEMDVLTTQDPAVLQHVDRGAQ